MNLSGAHAISGFAERDRGDQIGTTPRRLIFWGGGGEDSGKKGRKKKGKGVGKMIFAVIAHSCSQSTRKAKVGGEYCRAHKDGIQVSKRKKKELLSQKKGTAIIEKGRI